MLPSEFNQDFAAQRRAMMNSHRLRERATAESLLAVVQETQGWAVSRLENDRGGAIRERLQGNFPSVQIALKAAKMIQNKTREHIKIIREEQQLKDMLSEALMKAEFPTQQDANVFALQAQERFAPRFRIGQTRKIGRNFEVEFFASPNKAGDISDVARKSKGRLTAM